MLQCNMTQYVLENGRAAPLADCCREHFCSIFCTFAEFVIRNEISHRTKSRVEFVLFGKKICTIQIFGSRFSCSRETKSRFFHTKFETDNRQTISSRPPSNKVTASFRHAVRSWHASFRHERGCKRVQNFPSVLQWSQRLQMTSSIQKGLMDDAVPQTLHSKLRIAQCVTALQTY